MFGKRQHRAYQLGLIFLVLTIGVGVFGYLYYESHKREIKRGKHDSNSRNRLEVASTLVTP